MFPKHGCMLTRTHTGTHRGRAARYAGAPGQVGLGEVGLNETEGCKSTGLLRVLALLVHLVVVQEEKATGQHPPVSLPTPQHCRGRCQRGSLSPGPGTSHWVQHIAVQDAPPWTTEKSTEAWGPGPPPIQGHTAAAGGKICPLGSRS